MKSQEVPMRRVALPFAVITFIWGGTWIVIRDQLGEVPHIWSVAYRFFIASAAMFAVALWRREKLGLTPAGWRIAAAAGLLQFVLNFNFVYQAEHHITSGLVAVVFALLLVPNALMARLFLGHPISRGFLLGAAVAIGGIALLFTHEVRADKAAPGAVALGCGLTFLGVLSASGANVIQATAAARKLSITVMLAWAMLIGAVTDTVLAFATSGPPVFDTRPGYIAGLFYLALAASAFAFSAYYKIIQTIGPGRAAYSSVLVPIIAMTLSTLFEGYRWSALAVAGSVLVLGGLVISLRSRNTA